MHRLDAYIEELEPKIIDIYANVPMEEIISLQQSLISYGWILLDSWVAWRTERFLLRKVHIATDVKEKWFNTPSSYTIGQLKAIWKFDERTQAYIKEKTGKSIKELFDGTIQKKRNASAHFSKEVIIAGSDYQTIKQIF